MLASILIQSFILNMTDTNDYSQVSWTVGQIYRKTIYYIHVLKTPRSNYLTENCCGVLKCPHPIFSK